MNFKANETSTKLRGGYYTPLPIAQFLSRWVTEIQPQSLLEPSCGDGIFLKAIADVSKFKGTITACEIENEEAEKTKMVAKKTQIHTLIFKEDFLEWSMKMQKKNTRFDGILGNPPFIRYQYLDTELQLRAEQLFLSHNLPFTKHTNIWVSFVLASVSLLRDGGRLGMVIPAEILHVLHAQSLRDFLLRECKDICLIDPEELWFENTLQGVMLLLVEKKSSRSDALGNLKLIPVKDADFLMECPSSLLRKAMPLAGEVLIGKKWMIALLNENERGLLDDLILQPEFALFEDIAEVDVGIVTGANHFFLVNNEVVRKYSLEKWAHPMFGRSGHVPGVIYDEEVHRSNASRGLPTNFLWFNELQTNLGHKKMRAYIQEGERQGLHERYKCRIRKPWYTVPSVYSTSVGMLKRCYDFPRLILNKVNAYTTDTAYRIKPKRNSKEKMVFSFLNSLTALSAELEGRHYGGGVLELVPSEIEKVLMPNTRYIKNVLIEELDANLKQRIPPQELLPLQDKRVLVQLGISAQDRSSLFNAWMKLRSRRQRDPLVV